MRFFEKQFMEERQPTEFQLLNHIPEKISKEQNTFLEALPTKEECRKIVFALNGDSCCGPDVSLELSIRSARIS